MSKEPEYDPDGTCSICGDTGGYDLMGDDICIECAIANRLDPIDNEPVYATLHFYYDDVDSMRRYRHCNQAEDTRLVLWGLSQWAWEDSSVRGDVLVELDKLCQKYGINLEE